MATIIQPSQGNGLTEGKDACWRVKDNKDPTCGPTAFDFACVCARSDTSGRKPRGVEPVMRSRRETPTGQTVDLAKRAITTAAPY